MSAVDDICHERLDKNATKFTQAQILVLKDIAFQIVYILDPRNQRKRGFFSGLWTEFKEQTPLKQLALVSGGVLALFAIVGGLYAGGQQAVTWWSQINKADKIQAQQNTAVPAPAPRPTSSSHPLPTPQPTPSSK